MSKAKSFKKTIVVAAAAGMMITTSIGTVSAGQIYSAYGAKAVQRLDALTNAEERLSEAIRCLEQAIDPEREQRAAE